LGSGGASFMNYIKALTAEKFINNFNAFALGFPMVTACLRFA